MVLGDLQNWEKANGIYGRNRKIGREKRQERWINTYYAGLLVLLRTWNFI